MILPEFLMRESDGFIHFTGHRIGLFHLVHYYNEGYSPEMLVGQYPTLPLALIYKSLAFYLENKADVDIYVEACRAEIAIQRSNSVNGPDLAELRKRLTAKSGIEAPIPAGKP